MLGPLGNLPSLALTAAATTLRLLASINEALAKRVSPEPTPPTNLARAGAPAAAAPRPAATAAPEPADLTGTAQATATTLDIPTLAAQPAAQVIAAIESLSTAELGDLYVHEAGHRRRRSVLAALETAAAPPAAAADDDLPPLDVRVPDELVYSTVGPKRAKRPNG